MGCTEDVVNALLEHSNVINAVVWVARDSHQLLTWSFPGAGAQVGYKEPVPSCTVRLGSQKGGI